MTTEQMRLEEKSSGVQIGKVLSVKSMIVGPEQAQKWLVDCHYDKQRPVRPGRVRAIANEMEYKRFTKGQIDFAVVDDREYLINGQHTLHAIKSRQLSYPLLVVRNKANDMEEVAFLYSHIDRPAMRTAGDIYNVFDMPAKIGLTTTEIRKLGFAVRPIMDNFASTWGRTISIDDVRDAMFDYQEEARQYFGAIKGAPRELVDSLRRGATVSVALVTLKYSVRKLGLDAVLDFWSGVACDDGLSKDDPRKVLIRHLVIAGMRGGAANTRSQVVSANYSARFIANCWNAWTENRPIKMTKVFDPSAPINIKYTPWNGTKLAKS